MAISSFGALLKIGDGGAPESFSAIAEVADIGGPSFELGTEESTHHQSTDGWREFVPTLLDGGEVEFELNFLPADASQGYSGGLLDDMVNRVLRNFQLVFPDVATTTWAFGAYVTGFEPDAPVEGKLSASVTLKISGKPTLE